MKNRKIIISGLILLIGLSTLALPVQAGDSDFPYNVGHAVMIINYVFKAGEEPTPLCRYDTNGDGSINIADSVYLINYIFKGGSAPIDTC